jgi:hypothetical protein
LVSPISPIKGEFRVIPCGVPDMGRHVW